jgi:hypothetical protein
LAGFRVTVHDVDRTITEQTGQVARFMYRNVIIPKIFLVTSECVGKVVHRSAAKSVEMIVPTLERTKLRQNAQMPFADQGRAVANLLQQRGQGRVFGGKTYIRVAG